MRAHIYRKRCDKTYWRKTAGHKEDKIIDITTRNKMPNIFDSQDTFDKYYDKYYAIGEIPDIIDNDKDLHKYYNEGADVTVHVEDEVLVGKIIIADYPEQTALVNLFDDNSQRTYTFQQIRRIL